MNNCENIGSLNVIIMGATGAVGGHVLKNLLQLNRVSKISSLGRNVVDGIRNKALVQYQVDVMQPVTYESVLEDHQTAICTLGVGQPSKVSKSDFLRVDKQVVLDFAVACQGAGIQRFELLSSVGADANSSSFYLRTKGELINELRALNFERLSIFQPSMILTPTNRYGFIQGVMLAIWPYLNPLLFLRFRKYRGISVEILGKAMAANILINKKGDEYLEWDDFHQLADRLDYSS